MGQHKQAMAENLEINLRGRKNEIVAGRMRGRQTLAQLLAQLKVKDLVTQTQRVTEFVRVTGQLSTYWAGCGAGSAFAAIER